MIRKRKEKAFHFRFHFWGFSFQGVATMSRSRAPCREKEAERIQGRDPPKKKNHMFGKRKKYQGLFKKHLEGFSETNYLA